MTNEEVQDAFVERIGNALKQLSEERDEARQVARKLLLKYETECGIAYYLTSRLRGDEAEIKQLSKQGGAYYEAILIARAALDNGDVDKAKQILRDVPVLE